MGFWLYILLSFQNMRIQFRFYFSKQELEVVPKKRENVYVVSRYLQLSDRSGNPIMVFRLHTRKQPKIGFLNLKRQVEQMFGIFDDFLKFCNITFGQKTMITLVHLAFNLNPFFPKYPKPRFQVSDPTLVVTCSAQEKGRKIAISNGWWYTITSKV